MLQSSSSEKKLVKPLKIVFWTQFAQKRGHYGPRPRWKKHFLTEITKADHQFSESFYFITISYVLTELQIFFYLEWCFLSKKCHFQQKQLWGGYESAIGSTKTYFRRIDIKFLYICCYVSWEVDILSFVQFEATDVSAKTLLLLLLGRQGLKKEIDISCFSIIRQSDSFIATKINRKWREKW